MNFWLVSLVSFVVTVAEDSKCHPVLCGDDSQMGNHRSNCIQTGSSGEFHYIRPCSPGYVCSRNLDMDSTCQFEPDIYHKTATMYIGQPCKYTEDCLEGTCLPIGQADRPRVCTASIQKCTKDSCGPGYYCESSNTTCYRQIEVGGMGCADDSYCVNNAGCNILNGEGSCKAYYSIEAGKSVGGHTNEKQNVNPLCQSGNYIEKEKNEYVCASLLGSASELPVKCKNDADCVSEPDPVVHNKTLQGTCECGYNKEGQGYCALFNKDEYMNDYLSIVKELWNSTMIQRCGTKGRYTCLDAYGTVLEKLSYNYHLQRASYYPLYQGTQDTCIKDSILEDYYLLESEYHTVSSSREPDPHYYSDYVGVILVGLIGVVLV